MAKKATVVIEPVLHAGVNEPAKLAATGHNVAKGERDFPSLFPGNPHSDVVLDTKSSLVNQLWEQSASDPSVIPTLEAECVILHHWLMDDLLPIAKTTCTGDAVKCKDCGFPNNRTPEKAVKPEKPLIKEIKDSQKLGLHGFHVSIPKKPKFKIKDTKKTKAPSYSGEATTTPLVPGSWKEFVRDVNRFGIDSATYTDGTSLPARVDLSVRIIAHNTAGASLASEPQVFFIR